MLISRPANIPIDFAPFATFAIYSAISVLHGNETLLAAKAFTALALVSLLTLPLLKFCQAMPALFQVVACFGRIESYLLKETGNTVTLSGSGHLLGDAAPTGIELQSYQALHLSHSPLVSLENATVAKSRDGTAILHEVTLHISRGITIIIGPVGSGKSTLLETILGENFLLFGTANNLLRNVAYCSQSSWIQNATIRQNIIGPLEYDEKWYEFTISACGLERDLDMIPGGDSSVTGSSGVVLSGGQKQRIALARAVYSKLEVVVLDNIFSGLDSGIKMLIRDRLFGEAGHFSRAGRSVIFATNSDNMYELADDIIVMDQGYVVEQGPYAQITKRSPEVASRFLSSPQGVALSGHKDEIQDVSMNVAQTEDRQAQAKFEERIDLLRQTGSWSVYIYYAQRAGYLPLFLTFAFTSLECLCNAFGGKWHLKSHFQSNDQC
jgi:ATP-binding cassette subfamily C (CFTR/MRP) protein 1